MTTQYHIRHRGWLLGGMAAFAAGHAVPVIAADYLSVEAAQRQLFPSADRFEAVPLVPTRGQLATIAALAGPQTVHGSLRAWRAVHGSDTAGYFFIDEVVGRQDLITYALGIDAHGTLSAVEVLSYRESHGGEIRNSAWRKQFAGRDSLSQLKFATDIKNIAGATMSSQHVTQGVRWLVALWQTLLAPSTAPSEQ